VKLIFGDVCKAGFLNSPWFDAKLIKDRAVKYWRTDPSDVCEVRVTPDGILKKASGRFVDAKVLEGNRVVVGRGTDRGGVSSSKIKEIETESRRRPRSG
jgi:hypothetical protein